VSTWFLADKYRIHPIDSKFQTPDSGEDPNKLSELSGTYDAPFRRLRMEENFLKSTGLAAQPKYVH
jgi:hypothetical protein